MRIVLDGRFLRRTTGGIGRYTQSLIREMAKLSSQDEFVVLITPDDVPDWKELVATAGLAPKQWQAKVVPIPHYSLAEQTQLPKILHELAPDLVHFLNFNHPILYRGKFVVTVHDLTILRYPVGAKQQSPLFRWGFRQVLSHAVASAATIIADSDATKQDIVTILGAKSEKIQTVYLGYDSSYQPINLPQRGRLHAYLHEKYGIRTPYLLFLSQWRPHKGIGILLDAFQQVRDQEPKLSPKLVLAGKPHPAYPEISQQVKNHPYAADITVPGFVAEDDLPKLYQAAEIFVCPSLYEGFGLPPLEAMACGTPVISSDSTSLPEVVADAGRLVPAGDVDALADAIKSLLKDQNQLREYHALGLRRARQFPWEKTARETLAIYHEALGTSS